MPLLIRDVEIVLGVTLRFRLSEPLRQDHQYSNLVSTAAHSPL
jgi:hypothetical protein